jgi:hypothetical protein
MILTSLCSEICVPKTSHINNLYIVNIVTCQPIVGLRNRAFLVSCPLNASLRGWGRGDRSVSPRSAGGGGKSRPRCCHTRLQGNAINSLATARLRQQWERCYSSLLSNRQHNSNWFSVNRREGYISPVTKITGVSLWKSARRVRSRY